MIGLGLNISSVSSESGGVSRGVSFSNTKSLSFDGTNDFANWSSNSVIPNLMAGGDFSWSYWVKKADFIGAGSGYNSQFFYALNFFGSGISTFLLGAVGEESHGTQARKITASCVRGTGSGSTYFSWVSNSSIASAFNNDAWNHVVFTFDTSGSSRLVECYVNGSEIAGTDSTSNNTKASLSGVDFGDIALGSQTFNAGSNTFDAGELDEISCYDKKLSSSEVTAIYNSGVPTDESSRSNLVGYWRLEDDGTDSSSNSNTLTISGATFTTDVPS
jgi:hypothetical protein